MNASEEMLADNADASYLDADLDATNLNTDYADTDADLCIRTMSLCCTCKGNVDAYGKKASESNGHSLSICFKSVFSY